MPSVSPIAIPRAVAMKRQTMHQFVPGLGYIAHSGAPVLPPTANGSKNCDPPAGINDGSRHRLQPPGRNAPIVMAWVALERAWASLNPAKGNRLAWPTAHLSKAGWEYVGPA